jgi:protein-tyrosine kinase
MTEDQQSLNLIQRALDRMHGGESSAPASVEKIASTQIPPRAFRPSPTPDEAANLIQPSSRTSAPRLVQLNMGALRRAGMINPEIKTSNIANEFRNIKRKVLVAARDKQSRELVNNLVMVTSSLPEEGKTFTSVNLALSLSAERDVQVLLIDCDLHRPSVGNFFENPGEVGLSELLSSRATDIDGMVHRCETLPNLGVLFSGKHTDNSPELVASTAMHNLLLAISKRYRDQIVVIDTPPALTSFEPAILAQNVHQTILVVSAQRSGRAQIEKSLDSVSACHNISLLFNRASKWEQRENGYYYNYAPKPDVA